MNISIMISRGVLRRLGAMIFLEIGILLGVYQVSNCTYNNSSSRKYMCQVVMSHGLVFKRIHEFPTLLLLCTLILGMDLRKYPYICKQD